MREHGIEPIDLLAVNLYPFAATVARPDCSYEDAVENIDIGGPAMVRAAAKNHASVTVVVDPGDYRVLARRAGRQSRRDRNRPCASRLAAKAFAHTAQYDAMVSAYFTGAIGAESATFPARFESLVSQAPRSALRRESAPAAPRSTPIRARSAHRLRAPSSSRQGAFVQQHRGQRHRARMRAPIRGAGVRHRQARQSLRRRARRLDRSRRIRAAYRTDPTSAFGGIIAFNRELDAAAARAILERQFVEVILAPRVSGEAQIAARRQGRRARAGNRRSRASPSRSSSSTGASPAACSCKRATAPRCGRRSCDVVSQARTQRGGARGSPVRVARREICQIECHRLREG